jgi:hypothetical protein
MGIGGLLGIGELLGRKLTAAPDATPTTMPTSVPAPTIDTCAGLSVGDMPAATPVRLDASTTAKSVSTTPAKRLRSKGARKRSKKLFAVVDRRGVVVGSSRKPVLHETPELHAKALLTWIGDQIGFTGRPVLYEFVGNLYAEDFCPSVGLKPFPWRTVAAALDKLPGVKRTKKHADRDDGRDRVKRDVYFLPDVRAMQRV